MVTKEVKTLIGDQVYLAANGLVCSDEARPPGEYLLFCELFEEFDVRVRITIEPKDRSDEAIQKFVKSHNPKN